MTDLENHLVKQGKSTCAENQFCGKGENAKSEKSILDYAHKFGTMCVARNIATAKKKFEARGKQCIWVGYAVGHAVGTHRLIDPRTKRIISLTMSTFWESLMDHRPK